MPGTITNSWSAVFSRTPTAYVAGPPQLTPMAIPVSNTSGQWLFAIVSWRQDAGVTGSLLYPSTVNISDDAGNFWIPVQSGNPSTGIVRCSVWMAPAARAANFVFVSPVSTATGGAYQSGLDILIAEVTADCPWYTIEESEFGFANQASTFTVTQTNTTTGLFSIGVVANDLNTTSMPVTVTSTGWTAITAVITTANGTNTTGDMNMWPFYATTAGSALSLTVARSSGVAVADFAGVLITVHGVTDLLGFPYAIPLENWPVLITEIASTPTLNADPNLLQGTTFWSGQNGTVAAATWPSFDPFPEYDTAVTPSLKLTPSGSAAQANIVSDLQPVNPNLKYSCLAFVYSVAGYSGTVEARVNWYNISQSFIGDSIGTTVSPLLPGTWTQLTFAQGVSPPMNAAFGAAVAIEIATSGNVPSAAVLYIGYCGFGLADSYENIPQDGLAWFDISSRNFTQGPVEITRGIQYEQQSLEAGTLTLTLANNDGALTFGNELSPYWPTIGDTDVPVRYRAVFPQSLTPYYVLASGYTDQVRFQWDEGTRYGFQELQASDAWSRLTAQMTGAASQEVLLDNPLAYISCSGNGTNQAINGQGAAVTLTSISGSPGTATASFTSSAISLAGDQGASCWQSTNTPNVLFDFEGVALCFYPPTPFNLSNGMTLEFWMSPVSQSAAQPTFGALVICSAYTRKGLAWTITINNLSGPGSTQAIVTYYDQATGVGTSGAAFGPNFLNTSGAAGDWFFAVTWTTTSLSVVLNPGGGQQATSGPFTVNFGAQVIGFSFGGNTGPNVSSAGADGGFANVGFMNIAIYGIAVFQSIVPQARLAAHFHTALQAWPQEIDTWRLARIVGYAGATPLIYASRGLDLPSGTPAGLPATADLDLMTPATDTNSQVASDYFTNVAASTLAFLYVNGPGTLIYRRKQESYDRANPQWVVGELDAVPLNNNTLGQGPFTTGWVTANSATLISGSLPAVSPLFEFAGQFHGNGSVALPQIHYGTNAATGVTVTPGDYYQFSVVICSPQGYAAGVNLSLNFFNASNASTGTTISAVVPLVANSFTYITTPAAQAPAASTYALLEVIAAGTPSASVQFYVTDAVCALVNPVPAGGAGATAPEAPYLVNVQVSSDRALLYNQAIITQYGTNLTTKFSGTNVTFTPSSGVVVTINNQPSINLRSTVPYQASSYLDNTAQGTPYYLNDPSIEDFANWIVQTLGAPLMRPDKVMLTPAATPQSMQMALQAEVGDTVTFRRRPLGSPTIQILTYISKISHSIDISTAEWTTEYELSPFPQGTVLACDDVIHGTITGGNYFGW